MKRLMIVDDEPFIVNGLYEFMLLGSGLELDVYKAFSGDEAAEWLQRTKMDIVISDIRMPSMSGLQLLELIRRRWPHCKVILLTGYNEFDYVYQAIRHDGVRYLLKTEGYDRILELVRAAIADIDEARKSEDLVSTASRQMKLALPVLQKDLFAGLLRGETVSTAQLAGQFQQLAIPMDANREVHLTLGRLEHANQAESAYQVKMAAERYMDHGFATSFLMGDDGMLVWLQQPMATDMNDGDWNDNGKVTQLKGMLELVLEMCEETFGLSVHFIVDSHAVSWDQVARRYSLLRAASGSLPVVGGRGSIAEYPLANAARTAARESELLETIMRQVKRLDLLGSFLDTGRKDEFLALLEELLLSAEQAQACHMTHAALGIYFPLSLLVQSHIHAWHMEERLNGAPDVYMRALHNPAAAPNRTSEAFRHIAPLLFEWRQNAQTSHAHTAIAQVQEYLLAHLDGDLSLVRLAEVSRLNPSYLSRLFKQVTGINLNVYIQEARMNRAIELLRESDLKVYEIARIAGFEYAPYFTKTFKKHFGFSPQEYRDRMASDVNRI